MRWEDTVACRCRYGNQAGEIFKDAEIIWEDSMDDYQGYATILAQMPDGRILPEKLESNWPSDYLSYTLTLGIWGSRSKDFWNQSWHQISRSGYNLVLQVNFPQSHNRKYQQFVKPADWHPFRYEHHPINKRGKHTLGWARIDVDLENDQALIEEVQNDWLRDAARMKKHLARYAKNLRLHTGRFYYGMDGTYLQLKRYLEHVLKPYITNWEETVLYAAIWFIRTELGIRKIFYHTYESGTRIKKICGKPPRSIYTSLPRKFCFKLTDECPEFLYHKLNPRIQRKQRKGYKFHVLEL